MPTTISELEAQRAKILKEIESKTGHVNNSKQDSTPSLNDWLNAAEEVMPESQKKPQTQLNNNDESYSSKILKTSHSNTSSSPFFSIVILLTLFLTLVGVIYIVYNTLNKDINGISSYKEQSTVQINELQEGLSSIQKSMATGGKTELFEQMEIEVAELKKQVASLQEQVVNLEQRLLEKGSSTKSNASDQSLSTATQKQHTEKNNLNAEDKNNKNQVVTEAILDKKLKLYYQQLENKIDQKLETLIKLIPADKLEASENSNPAPQASSENENIEVPTAETVVTPTVNTPKLTPVASVSAPSVPALPVQPEVTMTEDEKWLVDQPKKNYILQLASMPSEAQIKRVLDRNKLDAKVVSQTRNGITNYILVSKAFPNKASAQELADVIKNEKGISAWVRQVEDIARRIK